MNSLLHAAGGSLPFEAVARNDEERDFYRSMLASKEIADDLGLA